MPSAVNAASAKKRSAPNAPGNNLQQPIYGTLPHNVGRYQQSFDLPDIYNTNNNSVSTLPHPPKNNSNNVSPNQQQQSQHQYDNKAYEKFEPYKASHKRSPSSDSITKSINLGKRV